MSPEPERLDARNDAGGGRSALANTARTFSIQLVSLAITLLDRVVLTGILIRHWGTANFSDWSIVVSAASMIVIFELGFQQFVGNQLLKAQVRSRHRAFNRIVAWSMYTAVLLGLVLSAGAVILPLIFDITDLLNLSSGVFVEVFIVLSLWNIVRITRGPLLQIYRGKGEYYQYLWADNRATLISIVAAIGAVLLGAQPLVIAIIYLITTIVFSVYWSHRDISRRFREVRIAARRPGKNPAIRAGSSLRWYGIFYTVANLMQNAPVLIIAGLGLSGPLLVIFVVQRTLVNFVRTVTLNISSAAGAELSSLAHQESKALFLGGLELVARLNVCLIALASSALLLFGTHLVHIWTGDPSLSSLTLLALLLIPAIIGAPAIGLQQTSVLADKVRLQASASLVNLTIGVGGGILLGMEYGMIGVALALALGESIGTGGMAAMFAARDFKLDYPRLFRRSMLLFAAIAGLSYGVGWIIVRVWPDAGLLPLMGQIALWTVITGPPALWLCLPERLRQRVIGRLRGNGLRDG